MSESGKSWSDLTPEQIEKLKTCETSEELLALAKVEGIELSDDQLEQVSGGDLIGWFWENFTLCPKCGSRKIAYQRKEEDGRVYMCLTCGTFFKQSQGRLHMKISSPHIDPSPSKSPLSQDAEKGEPAAAVKMHWRCPVRNQRNFSFTYILRKETELIKEVHDEV